MHSHTYIAIGLKSFYASTECADRKLDPMTTNLVVADQPRTDKTICLAVSPSLKGGGIPGRPRLFEVVRKVRQITSGKLRIYLTWECYQPYSKENKLHEFERIPWRIFREDEIAALLRLEKFAVLR